MSRNTILYQFADCIIHDGKQCENTQGAALYHKIKMLKNNHTLKDIINVADTLETELSVSFLQNEQESCDAVFKVIERIVKNNYNAGRGIVVLLFYLCVCANDIKLTCPTVLLLTLQT